MILEGEKSSMVVLLAEGPCYKREKKLSAIRREGDDAIVIFGGAGQAVFKIGRRARL